MQVAPNKVVSIDYTLTNEQGQVLDQSTGRGPLVYLHGQGNLIPGMEEQLEGKQPEQNLQFALPPEKAYGERRDELVQAVPRESFPDDAEVKVGMQFQAQTEAGPTPVRVVDVGDSEVTIDANHPLAGETLNFDVTVVEVRDATPDELENGQVQGPEGEQS